MITIKNLQFEMHKLETLKVAQQDHDAPAVDIAETQNKINYYRDYILRICRSEY